MLRKGQSETGYNRYAQRLLAWLHPFDEKSQKLSLIALLVFSFSSIFEAFFLSLSAQAETVTYTYDETTSTNGVGRLTSVSDASGTTKLFYDNVGRVTKTDKIVDATTFTTQTSFDLASRVKSVTYPDGDVVKYDYNGALLSHVYRDVNGDSVYTAGTDAAYAQYTGYNALGQPGAAAFGSTVTTTYTYSTTANADCPQQNFRLCKVTTTKSASTFQNVRYSYDTIGNITGITDAIATGGTHTNQTQSFGYDALNRLTSATGAYGAITYHYSQTGNMLCNSALPPATPTATCDPTSPNYASNYTYGDAAHVHAVTSAGGVNYTYDANGNMITRGTDSLVYDSENRLSSVTVASATTRFVYDGDGGRVKKISGGSAFVYIGKLFECVAPCKVGSVWSGTKHLFAGSVRIASKPITTTGEIAYYHPDHLGSTSVVTDKNGAITAEFAYLPFGESYPTDNPAVHYKYTGKERDTETALYFYGARYYDSRIGRFISADSIVQSKRNPQFLNRYSYVMNNPVKLIDPSGHVATCGVWGSSCGNSGVNNPCGNGNCGPTPPSNSISQNSASGTGGQGCPPGGCFGAPGTSEGLGFGSSRQAGIVPVPVVSTGTQEIVPILIAVSSPGSVPPMSELSTAVSSLINTEEMQFGGTCTSAAPCTMLGNLTYLPHLDAYRLTLKGPYRGIVFVKGISSVSDDYSIKPTETNFGFVVHDAEVTPHCCYPAPPFFTDNYGQKHAQVGYIDVTYGDATSRISGFKTHEWQTTFDTGGPTNPGQDFML